MKVLLCEVRNYVFRLQKGDMQAADHEILGMRCFSRYFSFLTVRFTVAGITICLARSGTLDPHADPDTPASQRGIVPCL